MAIVRVRKENKPVSLGRGHSSEVFDIGKGSVVKKFLGKIQDNNPLLEQNIEFKNYIRLKLFRYPVIVPMKWTEKGLKMPKLKIVTRSALPHEYREHGFLVKEGDITTSQLKTLWNGLRDLSKDKICTADVLQVGVSAAGRPYFFDTGGFRQCNSITDAELDNEAYWSSFCDKIGRPDMKELYPERPTIADLVKELNDGGKKD